MCGKQFNDASLKFPDVFGDVGGNELNNSLIQIDTALMQFTQDDGFSCFIIGRLDVGGKSPVKAGNKTVFYALDLFYGTVCRKNDLFVGLVKSVENMEYFLLSLFLSGKELDIIDDKDIYCSIER